MITESDVEMAYKWILGRSPENRDVVRKHVAQHKTIADMRRAFLASDEAKRDAFITGSSFRPDAPPMQVECDVPEEIYSRILEHIEQNWQILGETEPYWSVLTNDKFKIDTIGDNLNEFYASGAKVANWMIKAAERSGIDLRSCKTCFELGCGVGRITAVLATLFETVLAADISSAHLRFADQALRSFKRTNVTFMHLNTLAALRNLPNFDVFISIIVLQHNPPPIIKRILETVLDKLAPGGIAYFQVPTYRARYRFIAEDYVSKMASTGKMEMHALPQPVLFDIIEKAGASIREIRENTSIAPGFLSNILLIQKHGTP